MSLLLSSCYTREHQLLRKIKCPRHYVLKPGGQPFVMERIPVFKNIKIEDAKRWGLNIFKRKKDKFGRYIQNFADYEQPLVAASYCKEQIYNVHHPVCQECNRRCFWK